MLRMPTSIQLSRDRGWKNGNWSTTTNIPIKWIRKSRVLGMGGKSRPDSDRKSSLMLQMFSKSFHITNYEPIHVFKHMKKENFKMHKSKHWILFCTILDIFNKGIQFINLCQKGWLVVCLTSCRESFIHIDVHVIKDIRNRDIKYDP